MHHSVSPQPLILSALRELFPGVPDGQLKCSVLAGVDNGTVSKGDVVVLWLGGRFVVAELLLCVSAMSTDLAVVSLWRGEAHRNPNDAVHEVRVTDETSAVDLNCVQVALAHRMSDDRRICHVFLPREYR